MPKLEHERGFTGTIRTTIAESESSWTGKPSASGPNIVVIVLDDVGYSQLGCYGSSIDTPSLDRIAEQGLRYANFHVTPLCSPTRACLLSGRNHHAVGMSRVTEMGNGFPNTAGFVAREAGMLSEILQAQGYRTMCVGKWHLMLSAMQSAAGPYDHWPLQRGFERFYGFLFGETSQWNPELFLGNERIDAPATGESGDAYHLSEAIVDRANLWLRQLVSADSDTPFFLYVAFAAAHSPHHVPSSYADKYRGRFDDGWDVERDRILARQRASGLLPQDQQLTPRNANVPPWDDLDDEEHLVYARMQEVFAGFLDHADVQIGRLLDELQRLGKLDDTLVIAISDNGASAEGGSGGTFDHTRPRHGIHDSASDTRPHLDNLGGPLALNHYPRGWAMAGNTPFKRYKSHTHSGGVRAPLLISWPKGIEARGETRRQFCHAIDLAPTVLDIVGIEAPQSINGIEQMPIHGVSLAPTLSHPEAPSPKNTQYFEMIGNRAIWRQGWKAVTFHERGADYDSEPWELYHLDEDIAELNDLANDEPERLQAMIDLWWEEAERYGVLPLDDHSGGHQLRLLRPGPGRWVLQQGAVLPHFFRSGPFLLGSSHRIEARIERDDTAQEGVLIADGGRFGGVALYVQHNRLCYVANAFGERSRVVSKAAIPPGSVAVRADVVRVADEEATVSLFINDLPSGQGRINYFGDRNYSNEPLEVGRDGQTPVDDGYNSPFAFSGRLLDVTIDSAGRENEDPETLIAELLRSE
jgi:arylsulfatase